MTRLLREHPLIDVETDATGALTTRRSGAEQRSAWSASSIVDTNARSTPP